MPFSRRFDARQLRMQSVVTMWADPRFKGLALECVVLERGQSRVRLYDCHAISVTSFGSGNFTCGGEHWDAQTGSGHFFEPKQMWTARATSKRRWCYQTLYMSGETLQMLAEQIGFPGGRIAEFARAHVLERKVSEAAQHAMRVFRARGRILEHIAALMELGASLFATCLRSDAVDDELPVIAQARRHLLKNFATRVSVAELARQVSRSPFHLIREFHRAMGVPPHHYATLLRVGCAEQLLRGGAPIVEAANEAGFCDQSHLSRCFRRVLGMTPGQYQRATFFRNRPAITAEKVLAYRLRNGEPLWRYWARLRSARAA